MIDNNLSDDEIYELLSTRTRREAVRYFSQSSDIVHSVEDIVGYLNERTEESVENIELKLHHVDLPKLENADFLLYESEEKKVTYLGDEDVEESLEAFE